MIINLYFSNKDNKKLMVVIDDNNRKKTIHFGQAGYRDFILYNELNKKLALEKRKNYLARHSNMGEDWNKSGIKTAGFWSRWLLWNKETLSKSIDDVEKRFNIKIINNL